MQDVVPGLRHSRLPSLDGVRVWGLGSPAIRRCCGNPWWGWCLRVRFGGRWLVAAVVGVGLLVPGSVAGADAASQSSVR